jgi:putative ATPase
VPLRLRQAPTGLAKSEGHGQGYRYAHDDVDAGVEGMNDRYLPEELEDRVYYQPKPSGEEAETKDRLDRWRSERSERSKRKPPE